MEKVTTYRNVVRRLFREFERLYNLQSTPGIETFVVFDEVRDHYFLMRLGWSENRRVRQIVLYVRLKEGKLWIEEDWTEEGIATELLKAGVSKDEIVLAFQPPEMRQLSEFAMA
jgi:hypothetical protein